jgi:hypothetical protein
MDDKTQQLAGILDEIATTLESYGDKHWAGWISGDADRIRSGDLTGVTHFLEAFGGMGSINDFYVSPKNGHQINETEVKSVNARLSSSLSKAWALARLLSGKKV